MTTSYGSAPSSSPTDSESRASFPARSKQFLVAQNLLPRSVVVEHNGEAVAPSEFSQRQLRAGDRLEIVKIVAGG